MRYIIFLLAAAGCLAACKKKTDLATPNPDTGILTEEGRIRVVYEHLFFATLQVLEQNDTSLSTGRTAACDSTLFVDSAGERYVTAIFGDKGCSFNNVNHTGSLRIDYTGRLSDSGAVITINPQSGYAIGNEQLQPGGTVTLQNLGDSAGITRYKTGWQNGIIKRASGDSTTFSWDGFRNLVYTSPDTFLNERVYVLNQSNLSGTTTGGRSFSAVYDQLKVKTECRDQGIFQPAAGTVTVTNDQGTVRLNFGEAKEDHTEVCDNFADYTNLQGDTYQVELR